MKSIARQIHIRKVRNVLSAISIPEDRGSEQPMTIHQFRHHVLYVMRTTVRRLRIRKVRSVLTVTVTLAEAG
jgi:uncharacterized protein (DUF2267 family)